MPMSNSSQEKIGIKEMHNILWKCRDFEISHLWQRSVFLTAFLIATITFYGAVLSKLIEITNSMGPKFIFLNIATLVICLLGSVFSTLWIKMAKGSKAWYEIYEKAIVAFERDSEFIDSKLKKIAAFNYPSHRNYEGFRLNNSLFAVRAGAYSVSKINIGIGQVFLVFWLTAYAIHWILFALMVYPNSNITFYFIMIVGLLLLILLYGLVFNKRTFKSSTIEKFSLASNQVE